ncbi:tyrosine-type recombinase/integrase [Salinibacterium hongtaonis]|uniref:tyrosine-type recombinase/integrase n=1 Tax=Homoserinimonas hongtaonis TaxID=2079791 RepID=UPI000D3436E5|nr:site-specific integrase [Salinibacterium hongtaonis]AWB90302.1 site-specific integrase [Salinibacterium hongtaonis]
MEPLPSGRYRAFYRRDGRKFTAPHTFATQAEGTAWLATEFADRTRGTWRDPDAGRVTMESYARDWLDSHPDLAPRTRDLYERNLRRWIVPRIGALGGSRGVELGAMDVCDLSPAVVRTWYAAIVKTARESAKRQLSRDRERAEHPARVWARATGMHVAATGKISTAVMHAWDAAGRPQPKRSALASVVPLERAGETTAAQAYRILRAILMTAVTDGLLPTNPCQIKGAGQVAHRERGTASPAEVAQLAAHMPPRYSAAVTLAAWSGLRFGELFALARRHVDLDAGTVRVERALEQVPGQPIGFGKTKTDKSRRIVNLPAFVVTALRAHIAEYVAADAEALLFPMPDGSPTPNVRISVAFRKARAVINRDDLHWHDLRHTGATLAYRAGASLPEVQARLGHTTMRAALIYSHAADDSDRVLADRLNALYGAPEGAPHLRAV